MAGLVTIIPDQSSISEGRPVKADYDCLSIKAECVQQWPVAGIRRPGSAIRGFFSGLRWTLVGVCFSFGIIGPFSLNFCQAIEAPEKLPSTRLFPEKTLAYLRVSDFQQLRDDFARSSLGKMSQDPQLKPIVDEFYASLIQETATFFGQTGLDLDELLSIPTGEVAVALLPPVRPSRRNASSDIEDDPPAEVSSAPAVAFLIDAGENVSGINIVLKRMQAAMGDQSEHLQKSIDRLTLHSHLNLEDSDRQFAYFIDQGVMVAVTNIAFIEDLALVWLGQAGKRPTLSDNPRFNAVMSRCGRTNGQDPLISFYLEPLGLLRALIADNPAAQMMTAFLPALGLDGFEAIGGGLMLSTSEFDFVGHIHVRLSSPKRAVLELIQPQSGSTIPEKWVPSNIATYATVNWDLQSTVKAAEQLYNQFRGQDALNDDVFSPANQRFGIDLRKDIVDSLAGRVSMIQGFVRPITADSQSTVLAFQFQNMKRFQSQVLPKLLESLGTQGQMQSERMGSIQTYVFPFNNWQNPDDSTGSDSAGRPPETCLAVVDDYFLVGDSRYLMRQIADALVDSTNRLNESLEFQLVQDQMKAQLQGKSACAVALSRPEESLKMFYDLVRDPDSRQAVDRIPGLGGRMRLPGMPGQPSQQNELSSGNPLGGAFKRAVEKHELPPFSVISQYVAPSGGYLVEEDDGLHFTAFMMRRN
jgi:hypothetical protein